MNLGRLTDYLVDRFGYAVRPEVVVYTRMPNDLILCWGGVLLSRPSEVPAKMRTRLTQCDVQLAGQFLIHGYRR